MRAPESGTDDQGAVRQHHQDRAARRSRLRHLVLAVHRRRSGRVDGARGKLVPRRNHRPLLDDTRQHLEGDPEQQRVYRACLGYAPQWHVSQAGLRDEPERQRPGRYDRASLIGGVTRPAAAGWIEATRCPSPAPCRAGGRSARHEHQARPASTCLQGHRTLSLLPFPC